MQYTSRTYNDENIQVSNITSLFDGARLISAWTTAINS